MLKVVLLDWDEKFVKFLEGDLLSLEETEEQYKIGRIHLKYPIEDINEARKLFRVGYKIWVYGDDPDKGKKRLKDCLYVINESIKNDYFEDNEVEFDAEDVLTELNNVPFFSQTDLKKSNGFTFENNNESKAVIVNEEALKIWFGDYFQIGVVQDVLNSNLEKISPTGTLTKMELLRFIEEETSNVFITRYEKDTKSNVIHKYLDFLNRKSSNASWKLNFTYYPPREIEDANDFPQSNESIQEETYSDGDEVVQIPTETLETIDESDFEFRILENNELIESISANDMGFTGNSDRYDVNIVYNNGTLYSTVTGYSYDPTLIDINNLNYQKASKELDDMIEDSITNHSVFCSLSKNVALQLFDAERDRVEYQQVLSPVLSLYDEDVLDLNYNAKNIEYDVNESDTFPAIAPILKNEGSEALTKSQMNTVITNWINLSVKKGDRVPMIVEKVSASAYPSKAQNVPTDYWCKLIKQTEVTDGVEFNQATAYWVAPFNKIAGEIYVADDEEVGIEYNQIKGRQDIQGLPTSTPKIGHVETSDTDKFAIFNDVCMKLKDKRYPELNIEVSVKNSKDYNIFNKVYVKVPGYDRLVTVVVSKTVKNAHDIGENKVEFNNSDVGTKINSKATEIIGENKSFKYGSNQNFTVTLYDEDGNLLQNKLITFSFYRIKDNNTRFEKAYNLKTNNQGVASIPIRLYPGDYTITCTYGGSIEYGSSSSTFKLNVYGTVPKKVTTTSKTSSQASKKKTSTTKTTNEKVTNTQQNVTGNTGSPISRSTYPNTQSGRISNSVTNKAKSIVGNLEGVAAVKALTLWVAENISFEDRNNFYQSPEKTLSRLRGNGCCQADLLLQMCDSVGVQSANVPCYYVHVTTAGAGHVFCKINGVWVDTCKKEEPYGKYVTGFGKIGSGKITEYPDLPFNRSY